VCAGGRSGWKGASGVPPGVRRRWGTAETVVPSLAKGAAVLTVTAGVQGGRTVAVVEEEDEDDDVSLLKELGIAPHGLEGRGCACMVITASCGTDDDAASNVSSFLFLPGLKPSPEKDVDPGGCFDELVIDSFVIVVVGADTDVTEPFVPTTPVSPLVEDVNATFFFFFFFLSDPSALLLPWPVDPLSPPVRFSIGLFL